jgi:hypothetical protein
MMPSARRSHAKIDTRESRSRRVCGMGHPLMLKVFRSKLSTRCCRLKWKQRKCRSSHTCLCRGLQRRRCDDWSMYVSSTCGSRPTRGNRMVLRRFSSVIQKSPNLLIYVRSRAQVWGTASEFQREGLRVGRPCRELLYCRRIENSHDQIEECPPAPLLRRNYRSHKK